MTSAPLPACPFCGADGEALRVLPPTCTPKSPYNPADRAYPVLRCGGCGASVPGEDWDTLGASAVAAWNRRAPEAQAWRAIETAPRDGTRILIADGRSTDAAYWSQCAKGYGGSKRYPWVILDETNGVNGMTETHPTHWQPLPAPPGATPASPPAPDPALVEALRGMLACWPRFTSVSQRDAIAAACAALAAADAGRG